MKFHTHTGAKVNFYDNKGRISIDYVKQKIQLTLINEGSIMETLTASIVATELLRSGENRVVARENDLVIIVSDMTNMACTLALAPTVVTILKGKEGLQWTCLLADSLRYETTN